MENDCRADLCPTCALRDWCDRSQVQEQNREKLIERMHKFGFTVN